MMNYAIIIKVKISLILHFVILQSEPQSETLKFAAISSLTAVVVYL